MFINREICYIAKYKTEVCAVIWNDGREPCFSLLKKKKAKNANAYIVKTKFQIIKGLINSILPQIHVPCQ